MLSFSDADVGNGENRLRDQLKECLCVREGADCFMLVRLLFFSGYLSKAVFIYTVRSPRFIPSPCIIPSPQSVVLSPQSSFYTYCYNNNLL